MKYPLKYKTLIEYLINYRKNKIEGYFTTIILSLGDIQAISLDTKEVLKMLGIIKEDAVRIERSKTKELVTVDVISGDVTYKNKKIKITKCSTDALVAYLEKIKADLKVSVIIVNNKKIKLPEMTNWMIFNEGRPFRAFNILHQSFPEVVPYHDIYKRMAGYPGVDFTAEEVCKPEQRVKTIQNIINHLQSRMVEHGFSDDTIKVVKGIGYRLTR